MKLHITPSVYFVKSGKALVDTLFQTKGTASGTYKIQKSGVLFMKPTGEPFAFLVANRHNERFFVTCSRQADCRIRYMHSLCDTGQTLLGLSGVTYIQLYETAERVWDSTRHLSSNTSTNCKHETPAPN